MLWGRQIIGAVRFMSSSGPHPLELYQLKVETLALEGESDAQVEVQ